MKNCWTLLARSAGLQPTQVAHAADVFVMVLKNAKTNAVKAWKALAVLAPRLAPAHVKCACDVVMGILENSKIEVLRLTDCTVALAALAPWLEPA